MTLQQTQFLCLLLGILAKKRFKGSGKEHIWNGYVPRCIFCEVRAKETKTIECPKRGTA